MSYDVQKKDNIILNKINTFFIYVIVLEIVLIAMLIWKWSQWNNAIQYHISQTVQILIGEEEGM